MRNKLFCPRCLSEDSLTVAIETEEFDGTHSKMMRAVYYVDDEGDVDVDNQLVDQDIYSDLRDRGWGSVVTGWDWDCQVCCVGFTYDRAVRYLDTEARRFVGVPLFELANGAQYRRWVAAGEPTERAAARGLSNHHVSEDRVGVIGFKKKRHEQARDEQHGPGNWTSAHFFDQSVILKQCSLALYETAYLHHLRSHPDLLDWICSTAQEVYDYSPKNVRCRMSYDMEGEKANHYQDIAVRRVVAALGRTFEGTELLQIRGKDSAGYALNPGQVPFHLAPFINQPETFSSPDNPRVWWNQGSVESFWQNNKVLLIRD